jgi:hypothetical protein
LTSAFKIPREKISESSVEGFFSLPKLHRTCSFVDHSQPSNYHDLPISYLAVDSVDTRILTGENHDRIFVRAPRRCQDRSPNLRICRTGKLHSHYRSAFFDPEEAAILSGRRTFFSNVPVSHIDYDEFKYEFQNDEAWQRNCLPPLQSILHWQWKLAIYIRNVSETNSRIHTCRKASTA